MVVPGKSQLTNDRNLSGDSLPRGANRLPSTANLSCHVSASSSRFPASVHIPHSTWQCLHQQHSLHISLGFARANKRLLQNCRTDDGGSGMGTNNNLFSCSTEVKPNEQRRVLVSGGVCAPIWERSTSRSNNIRMQPRTRKEEPQLTSQQPWGGGGEG